jgi:hypothetical protein
MLLSSDVLSSIITLFVPEGSNRNEEFDLEVH